MLTKHPFSECTHSPAGQRVGQFCMPIRTRLDILARSPHNNASKRADYKDYFNEKNKKLFDRIYRDDIDRLGYSF